MKLNETRGCESMLEFDIHQRLEALTNRLHRLVDEKEGNLRDPGVVAVSQEMDRLIVFIQRDRLVSYKSCR
jgi:hypothetical protein